MRYPALALALLLIGTAGAAPAPAQQIVVAGGARPAILDRIDLSGGVTAAALSPDGRHAAVTVPDPQRERRSRVRLYSAGRPEPAELALPGIVRGLLFSPDSQQLFLIMLRPAKRRLGESDLLRIEVATAKSRTVMRLPSTAASLDYWMARDAILVAVQNEIRTIRMPELRSGPLFRIPGNNLSVASLASSDTILVGQDRALLLVQLSDPPGEEAMPVRMRVDTPGPVTALAATTDGTAALARLFDGRTYRVRLDPLGLVELGTPAVLVAPAKGPDRNPLKLEPPARAAGPESGADADARAAEQGEEGVAAESAPPAEEATGATAVGAAAAAAAASGEEQPSDLPPPPSEVEAPSPAEPAASAAEEPGVSPAAESAAGAPEPGLPEDLPEVPPEDKTTESATAVAAPAAAATRQPAQARAQPEPAAVEQPPPGEQPAPRPPDAPAWPSGRPPQVWGRIGGAAAGEVEAVLLFGPNNVLREAGRVEPDGEGRWSAEGLAPGRYQVQLSAGGNKVLVTEPRFAVIEVSDSGSVQVPDFRVLRVFVP